MKHIILGTAGHVDHGKTALVKALTGTDCDTHREEKRRGITINLGFTHLSLPSGDTVGIVDVPGHRDFVHTMVGGASGIDIALLVVAADEGVMPQTKEHLQIMQMLGIRAGLVALTRIDLSETGAANRVADDVRKLVAGTFMNDCPIVKVSAITGEGVDELRMAVADVAGTVGDRPAREVFRMYVDRIFSVAGHGTVVTGSVLGGTLRAQGEAYLMPQVKPVRVRRIERYGQPVEEARAGDRASLNLTGFGKSEFVRGMVVSDRRLATTTLLDGSCTLFEKRRAISLWSNVLFLMGTFEAQVRMHLIDCDELEAGGEAVVQIHLPTSCTARYGDRFVLRDTAGNHTIGGGFIIDPAPLHHRRRPESLVRQLRRLAQGNVSDLIATEIKKHPGGIGGRDLAVRLNLSGDEIKQASETLPADMRKLSVSGEVHFVDAARYDSLMKRFEKILADHHRKNPLLEEGKTTEELSGALGLLGDRRVLMPLLEEMVHKGKIGKVKSTWALAGHAIAVPAGLERHIEVIEEYLAASGMKTPLPADLNAYAADRGITATALRQILGYLVSTGRAYYAEGHHIHASVVDECRKKLLSKLAIAPEGLTVAQFRDLVGGNRKICLLLYALFDAEGSTERLGDVRVITKKGKENI